MLRRRSVGVALIAAALAVGCTDDGEGESAEDTAPSVTSTSARRPSRRSCWTALMTPSIRTSRSAMRPAGPFLPSHRACSSGRTPRRTTNRGT